MRKYASSFLLLLWMTLILAAFFVVQKPDLLQIPSGISYFTLTLLIPAWMTILASAIGGGVLHEATPMERLIIGTAIGWMLFGLTGFGLALTGWAQPPLLIALIFLLTVILAWFGRIQIAWSDLRFAAREFKQSASATSPWISMGAGFALLITGILSLAPPVEDFDALFYHLTVPSIWLNQGADTSYVPIPHYWYPQIVEGMYVWPLSLGTDTATHLVHLMWLVLSALLIWYWTKQINGANTAWNAIALLLTMPSLPWLASWAYTDYTLSFAGLASIYALWRWKFSQAKRWLLIGGGMAGLAISTKYTGFIVPVAGVLLLLIWERRIQSAFQYGIICTLVAAPWYLRNWIGTGNPVYPFVFGGLGWDNFLAQTYAGSGSGLGWDLVAILMLPITATLGIKDANYFDGRIGPFFLILLPMVLFVFWEAKRYSEEKWRAVQAIGIFSLLGASFWTLGVITSAHLFQTRLLFPVLLPLTIPLSLGIDALSRTDIPQFKASFIFRSALALVVIVNLIGLGLQVTNRNPLAAILGMTPRDVYIAKRQPNYADALSLTSQAPSDAVIYLLFEPRKYGMTGNIQPDAINANFEHDVWLYHTPLEIINAWKQKGYTHVLLSNAGADFILATQPDEREILEQIENLLIPVKISENGNVILYLIP